MRGTLTHVGHGRGWIQGFDGIRGICLLCIITMHVLLLGDWMPSPGPLHDALWRMPQGLTAFFVLSGFLLWRPYVNAALGRRVAPATLDLYRRRFLRVYPTHTVVLIVTAVILPLGLTIGATKLGRLPVDAAFANVLLIQGYIPHLVLSGIGPSWTLVVDLAFYALLPVMWWIASRAAPRLGPVGGLLVPIVPVLVGGALLRPWIWGQTQAGGGSLGKWSGVIFYTFPGQMDLMAAGMLGAVLAGINARRVAQGLVGVGVAALLFMDFGVPGNTPFALGVAGALALMTLPSDGRRLPSRLLSWQPLRWLGWVSYATYLWHLPVINATERWGPGPEHAVAYVAVIYGASIVLGWLTTRFIGDPAIAYADKLSRQKRSATATADPT